MSNLISTEETENIPNEEREEWVPPTTYGNILNYITNLNILYSKVSEHPWGSYQLGVSFNGSQYMVIPQYFGWGFAPHESLSIVFTQWVTANEFPDIVEEFIGSDMIQTLKNLKAD